ncbi:hypothetical protein ABZ619_38685 [Streptomyces sp. NPDC007851]|uniref:hypothetical protein n=1 Tax=Streptomyces sp. NPDC007851 TaxID=3155008 RepID=UPI0033D341CB
MTTTTVQARPNVRNERALAEWLADNDLRGRRTMTAIIRLRRERARNQPAALVFEPMRERFTRHLVAQARAEILRRGGEVVILGKNDRITGALYLVDRDRAQRIILVKASGWRYYSSRSPQRYVELAYLYGTDDAGPWAVRVPGTMSTVAEALAWLTPNDVVKALDKGLRVRRQGDVYAIETTVAHDGSGARDLPEGHEWRPDTRYLVHTPADGRKHRPVRVTYPVRFVMQSAYEMGRSGARVNGD